MQYHVPMGVQTPMQAQVAIQPKEEKVVEVIINEPCSLFATKKNDVNNEDNLDSSILSAIAKSLQEIKRLKNAEEDMANSAKHLTGPSFAKEEKCGEIPEENYP